MATYEGDLGWKLKECCVEWDRELQQRRTDEAERRDYVRQQQSLATMADAAVRAYGNPPVEGNTPPRLRQPHLVTRWMEIYEKGTPLSIRLQAYFGQSRDSSSPGEIARVDCQLRQPDGSVMQLFKIGHGQGVVNALNEPAISADLELFQEVVSHAFPYGPRLDGGV
ncbi:MAG: hypothetical protein UY20_C0011G0007 [Candidatus Yanofskybacteria bacterium GW2011_GWA1_48_10]|uniref:Uncharacterized protein n=1 Tax=Candidatus Yanofskybacteria bacterium GW2011_GWA1_48_10 TaxID=1619022 RepID=A0A0G1X4P6_9BACT|nr:MAG: hypothetical protein UY20_C0011G0007 [Candidatus Yanofskybacteria bacterium GW2011_GWA1_48_10]